MFVTIVIIIIIIFFLLLLIIKCDGTVDGLGEQTDHGGERVCNHSLLLLILRFPARSLGLTILGEIFAYVTVFFNTTIEVVTFHLRGWCILGVFLLWAFTHLGHKCQDLLSPCNGMQVCTD